MSEQKIKVNAARCMACGDVIESKTKHDWRQCSCGLIWVDGGHDYIRRGGDFEKIQDLTEYE